MSKWAKVNAKRARQANERRLLEQQAAQDSQLAQALLNDPLRTASKAERRRWGELRRLEAMGQLEHVRFQPMSVRLGKGVRYEPDFGYVDLRHPPARPYVLEECKGARGWRLDSESRTKFLAAAAQHPQFVFRLCVVKAHGFEITDETPWEGR